MRISLGLRLAVVVAFLVAVASSQAIADTWQAGAARVNITPQSPLWLSGYAGRDRPAEGRLTHLWAKALVLEDAEGRRAVLVTMDLVGIDRELSLEVCRRVERKYGLPRSAVVLSVSHTHTGPVVGSNLAPMYSLNADQRQFIAQYTANLADKLVEIVGAAIDDLRPAQLSWGVGQATFAVNRRNNPEADVPRRRAEGTLPGPVDHDVPVLAVRDTDGRLRAITCGYACHATVLNTYEWSGDWPGFAQIDLEKRHPEATVLFWAGCGADQNPLPRRSVELAQDYGRQLADAVDLVLHAPMETVRPSIETAYDELDLPFASLPSHGELVDQAGGDGHAARRAKMLLAQWERHGCLKDTYPYPVQAWQLGRNLNWNFLGGEVVVDYSLRVKQELAPRPTWTAAYANDVMAYIPSRRVLQEGGYEGGGAMLYYGLPGPWDEQVEELIVNKVRQFADHRDRSRSEIEHSNSKATSD